MRKSVLFQPDNKTKKLIISGKCSFTCPGCSKKNDYSELPTETWKKKINLLKNTSVENIVFGGAEPLMRTDLIQLVKHAKKLGLKSALTTNAKTLYEYDCGDLRNFEYVIIGWHKKAVIFERSLEQLKKCGVPRIISYCYDKRHECDLRYIKTCADFYDAEIVFKCYEPVGENDHENRIPFEDVLRVVEETKKEGFNASFQVDLTNNGNL